MVLQQVASRLREQLRQNDTVARIGDDEFAIVLPGTDRNGAVQAAEKVLRALRLPYHVGGQDIDLGTTMGIAVYPEHGGNADTITRRGDVAMHVAKRTRRDWAEFSPEQEDSQLNRLVLTRELRTALENNELVLHYLPKVSLKTGRIEGVEALVRWHHPERGLIEPDEFISLAENTGVIPLLTMQVMSMALRQWRAWHDMGTDLRISVNLSPRLLLDSQLISTVSGLLETWGVDPSWLEVELPESALSGDPERALGMLSRLKEKGLRITIDDFGTGSSSLPLLRRLPVSEIKIDRSFVSRMLDNPDDGVIVRSIVDLGHNLGYQVLAEGVEGRQAFDMLTEMGCDLAQGTYLSEPLTALDLIRRYGGSAPSTSSVAL
jgi:predicted signal transduction protein with EAL and GGDEF domain